MIFGLFSELVKIVDSKVKNNNCGTITKYFKILLRWHAENEKWWYSLPRREHVLVY